MFQPLQHRLDQSFGPLQLLLLALQRLLLLLVGQKVKLQLLLRLLLHQQVELRLVARFLQLALQAGDLPLQLLGIAMGTCGGDGQPAQLGDTLIIQKQKTSGCS